PTSPQMPETRGEDDRPAAVGPFSPAAAVDGQTSEGGWALLAADGLEHRLVVEAAEPVGSGDETTITAIIHQNAGEGRTLGRFRLLATTDAWPVRTDPGPEISKEILQIAAMERDQRTSKQKEDIAAFYRRVAPELAYLRAKLRAAELWKQELLSHIPQSYITTTEEPQPVRILARGNWQDESGEIVSAAVPHFLRQIDTGGRRPTRLDLARWLTSKDNPLTARVFVN